MIVPGEALAEEARVDARGIRRVLLAAAAALAAPSAAHACAVCGLDDYSFIWSYLFLTGVPLMLAGAAGGYFFFLSRRGKKKPLVPRFRGSARLS